MTESNSKNTCKFHFKCDARKHNVVCQKSKSCFEEQKVSWNKNEVEDLIKDFSKQFNLATDYRQHIVETWIKKNL